MVILSYGQVLLPTLSPKTYLLLFNLWKYVWSGNIKTSIQLEWEYPPKKESNIKTVATYSDLTGRYTVTYSLGNK